MALRDATGSSPTGEALLYGIKPVVIAIVAAALVAFARTALTGPLLVGVAVAVAVLWVLGVNELAAARRRRARCVAAARPWHRSPWAAIGLVAARRRRRRPRASVNLLTLARVFLKTGALLYGSGYVLLAFLRGDFVERLGWLTDAQLLDAVAIGQVDAGTAVHDGDVHRLRPRRRSRGAGRDGGHLPAGLRLRGAHRADWPTACATVR